MGTVGMAAAVATTPVAAPVAQTFANPQPTEPQTETGTNEFMPPLTDSATSTLPLLLLPLKTSQQVSGNNHHRAESDSAIKL